MPVGVAARSGHQIGLASGALHEGAAKLREQIEIAADCGSERGIECTGIINHEMCPRRDGVNAPYPSLLSHRRKDGKQCLMNMGAERAESEPNSGYAEVAATDTDWLGTAETDAIEPVQPVHHRGESSAGAWALAALLLILAIGWVAAFSVSLWQTRAAFTLPAIVAWTANLSTPLVLLGLIWLWLGRTPRREAERFGRAVRVMHGESSALERVLAVVAGRIEENHARLRGETEKLMSLGDEASDRLGRVTYYLSKESGSLDRTAAKLESAAAAARVDLGVLLHDLPKAEEQSRSIADAMKDAGLAAHSQAGALEAQLAALSARGREADEIVGSAAQRLAAHVARIDSNAASAAATIGEASETMNSAVDGAMARAAESIDAARASLEAQAEAMLATIDQSRVALDIAGEDAARSLSHRVDEIGGKIQTLADQLVAQDEASQALLTGLTSEIKELDARIVEMGLSGGTEMDRLTGAIDTLRAAAAGLLGELGAGQERAGTLIRRTEDLAEALSGVSTQLNRDLPESLAAVETQSVRAQHALSPLAPMAEQVRVSADAAAAQVAEAEGAIARGRESLEALLTRLGEGTGESEERLLVLREIAGQTRLLVTQISENAGPELIGRANLIAETLALVSARLQDELPSGLASVEAQAEHAHQILSPLVPLAGRVLAATEGAAERAAEAESTLTRIGEGAVEGEARLDILRAIAADTQTLVARIAADSGPELFGRATAVAETLAAIADRLGAEIPAGLAGVAEQAERTHEALAPLAPLAGRVQASAKAAADRAAETESTLARIGEGATHGEARLDSMRAIAGDTQEIVARIAADSGPELFGRANAVSEALAAIADRLNQEIPAGLAGVEAQAERTREALAPLAPLAGRVHASAEAAAERAAQTESTLARIGEGAAEGEARLEALRLAAGDAHRIVTRIGEDSGPELTGRFDAVAETLAAIALRLNEELPTGLAGIESRAERTFETMSPLAPLAASVHASADAAADRLAHAEAAIGRQREALDSLLLRIEEGSAAGQGQLEALGVAAEAARDSAARIAAETGPELIEALLRVREAANQAAERARDAIAEVIPRSAASLGEASRQALALAVSETVEAEMAGLAAASQRALAAASEVSARLTRQLVGIGETAAMIEQRIDEDREEREAQDSENFSRRVALLIESLNSTAIDVTKILSNDVTDSAWAAYLKGDRGVFTRRAVRLLDNSEAREIVRHYDEEPEFREQVNRYIHDFEAMLRRILADRDGSPLGVTLLSSDMGKLYVALAQAIDRLRT